MSYERKGSSEFPEVYTSQMKMILECMSVTFACARRCLEEGHKETAILCSECADICFLAMKALSRKSTIQNQIINLCMQSCKDCADACKKVKVSHCQECSAICLQCADLCSPSHR